MVDLKQNLDPKPIEAGSFKVLSRLSYELSTPSEKLKQEAKQIEHSDILEKIEKTACKQPAKI